MRLRPRLRPRGALSIPLLAGGLLLGPACGQPADTGTSSGLPPETGDGGATDGGSTWTGEWTGDGAGGGPEPGDDEDPGHLLSIVQEGSWSLSPVTGPYESLTGSLVVTELLDGEEDLPACTATFALTGTALGEEEQAPCDGCEAVFEVLHYLSQDGATIPGEEGEEDVEVPGLSACLDPDLPGHEETWILGLADDAIHRRLGLGGWQEWYEAERIAATVRFEWSATVGVEGDDEEETQ